MHARWGTGRTEAFSDGVFAIAITILVLELSVPAESFSHLWKGILEQWPSYLGYVTSFLTIGGIWLSHHSLFGRLQWVDRRIMQLNLVLLMAVSFLPFPTKLMAESINDQDAERAAVIFYGLVLLSISIIVAALWRVVANTTDLVDPEVDKEALQRIAVRSAPSIGFYIAITLLAVVAPRIAAVGYLIIAVSALMTAKGEDPGVVDGTAQARHRLRFFRRRDHGENGKSAASPEDP